MSTESVSVSITVITCESLHTTYTLPVGAAAEVARYAGCPLIGIVAVTVLLCRFTTDTVQVVDTPATATPFAAQGSLGFPALATYARVWSLNTDTMIELIPTGTVATTCPAVTT